MQRQHALSTWLRNNVEAANAAEMVSVELQHPTMQALRQALTLVGQASRDVAWVEEHGGAEKLRQAMELLVELTSVSAQ